jgi:hypothetical protein
VSATLKRCLPFGLVGLTNVWIVSTISLTGDWSVDSGPAVQALAHGRVGDYLAATPGMGPFATLVQAPFAALAGGGELNEYRWATLPCLLAVGLLGLYLASVARRRGASPLSQSLIAALCLINPLTFEALKYGHPEELLTAALAVAAVATASEGRERWAAVLLGLALASKQWAVIAILPTLMALPSRRLRTALGAAAVVALLNLPAVVASPTSLATVLGNAATTGSVVTPWSVWYPLAEVTSEVHRVGGLGLLAVIHRAPPLLGTISHSLIVLLVLSLPLGLAARRGRFRLSGEEAMALLAFLALLRCALDPWGNLYYHEPLLIALLGWDALTARGLPVRGMAGAAVAFLLWRWAPGVSDTGAFNALYIAVVITAGLAIATAVLRSGRAIPVVAGLGSKPEFSS